VEWNTKTTNANSLRLLADNYKSRLGILQKKEEAKYILGVLENYSKTALVKKEINGR
jgi:hypothetical protein